MGRWVLSDISLNLTNVLLLNELMVKFNHQLSLSGIIVKGRRRLLIRRPATGTVQYNEAI